MGDQHAPLGQDQFPRRRPHRFQSAPQLPATIIPLSWSAAASPLHTPFALMLVINEIDQR